jgi:D-alanine-D-alanine ligase-like ATP-grasp enzyme
MADVRIVLLDQCWNQTYYLADGLRRAGCEVHLISTRPMRTIGHLAFGSTHRLDPLDTDDVQPVIDSIVERVSATHVLPMTDRLLNRYKRVPPVWAARMIPQFSPAQRAALADKTSMTALAVRLGLPVPRTGTPALAGDAERLAAEFGFPIVVRSPHSTAGRGVAIARDVRAMRAALARFSNPAAPPYLQRFLDGGPIVSGGLFQHGRAVRYFACEKRAMHPADTGPATIIHSLDDQTVRDQTLRLFEALEWTGYGQVDWARDRDGAICFLELNPRPWGAMGGMEHFGVDLFTPFAAMLAGDTPRADLSLRGGEMISLFPQYVRAGLAERGWRALFERRSWERLPWSRPTLAWHLGQFLLHDLWERLAWRGRRVQGALAVPAPAPGLPESHPVP